jgi:hypothetical protein
MLTAVLVVIAMLGATALVSIYAKHLPDGGPFRADATSYYVYLPAVFLDHDITLARTLQRSFGGDPAALDLRVMPGGYLDKHQVGEAFMLTPFFALGHGLAVVGGARRDGFSWPYEATAAAAGLFYTLVGLAVLGVVLLRWFGRGTVAATLLAITFGTNLFHYATFDAVYSHAFSFALVALVLWSTVALTERPRLGMAAVLGGSLGLAVAIRSTNLALILFPLLVALVGRGGFRTGVQSLRHRWKLLATGAGAFALPLVPQLLYWHTITGRFVINPYGSSPRLDLLHPHLLEAAFSVRKGLFFWTPLLVLAVAGLPLLRRISAGLFWGAAVFLVVDFWIVASWTEWWYGGSFGQRPIVDVLPIYALGFAAALAWVPNAILSWTLRAAVVVSSFLALNGMVEYWLGHIPYDETTWSRYLESFGKF